MAALGEAHLTPPAAPSATPDSFPGQPRGASVNQPSDSWREIAITLTTGLHCLRCKFSVSENPSLEKSRKSLETNRCCSALFMLRCDRTPAMLTCYQQLSSPRRSVRGGRLWPRPGCCQNPERGPASHRSTRKTLFLPAEDFAKRHVQVIERAGAVTRKARSVHDGERFGL